MGDKLTEKRARYTMDSSNSSPSPHRSGNKHTSVHITKTVTNGVVTRTMEITKVEGNTQTQVTIKAEPRQSSDGADLDKVDGNVIATRTMKQSTALCLCGCACLCGCGVVACWILSTVLAIMSIVYGALYLDDCAIDHRIPIVLIVAGCFQLGHNFTTFCLFGLTAVCSWVATIVIVYLDHSNVNLEDRMDPNYCHPSMYGFGSWASIVSLINTSVLGSIFACARSGSTD